MARRYDSRTTIFSPEGRLYQVEYAMEAISNAGAAIGILTKDGVILIAEKKITSKVRGEDDRDRVCAVGSAATCKAPLQHMHAASGHASLLTCINCGVQLLDTHAVGVRREKMYKLDDHVCCAVAGLTGAL